MHWKITALWGGKKVELRETQRAVTPFGGLVVFFEFLRRIGYCEAVREHLPFSLRSPNADRSGEDLHGIGFRGRATALKDHVGWRATWECGGRPGKAVCWPGRSTDEPLAQRSRRRSEEDLRHQCRETLQMGAKRKASHSQKTKRNRDCGLPSLVGSRDCSLEAHNNCLPWGNRGSDAPWTRISGYAAPRGIHRIFSGAICYGDSSPVFDPKSTG